MSEAVKQRQLQALLSERDSLRAEILQKFQHHLQLYAVLAPVVVGVLAAAVGQHLFELLVFVPIMSTTLACRYLWEEHVINVLGDYLLDTECRKLPELIDRRPTTSGTAEPGPVELWVGWEHYFHRRSVGAPFRPYKAAAWLAFIVIPFLPALCVSILAIGDYATSAPDWLSPVLPAWSHVLILVMNLLLGGWLVHQLWSRLGPTPAQTTAHAVSGPCAAGGSD